MLFIKQLLTSAGLIDDQWADHSVACISTTRPIYLVFGQSPDYPLYVVRKMTDNHALQANNIHNQLHRLVGNLVPEPVGVYEYAGGKYDVQRGVKGAPWFQIKSKIRSVDARGRLEARMWQTLTDFQAAIGASNAHQPDRIQPHEELRNAYEEYKNTGEAVKTELEGLIRLAIDELSQVPGCAPLPQHGDFCLNNLIIDTNHITVIDFEDFAITKMPMYDQFTLALSLPSCGSDPADAAAVYNQASIITAADTFGIPKSAIKWHFLHHILLRLGPWSIGEKRASYRSWLIQVLDCFLAEQLAS